MGGLAHARRSKQFMFRGFSFHARWSGTQDMYSACFLEGTRFPLQYVPPDTELLEFVYGGDRFGGIWL